ncbi:hypothetical protein K7X08_010378 [Anisodus acutangulus]|uniref:Uncharacterized protein n=1 Tax=Anisodus acutangulus TaxID=402998 RepID=A0A9Q1N112_9SOLA|nr:hypothetical protein K7X08_010378 [Anisodus acutangulus]
MPMRGSKVGVLSMTCSACVLIGTHSYCPLLELILNLPWLFLLNAISLLLLIVKKKINRAVLKMADLEDWRVRG